MSQWGAYGYAQHGWSYRADPRALLPRHDDREPPVDRPFAFCSSTRGRSDHARLGCSPWRSSTAAGRRSRCPPASSCVPASLVVAGKKLVLAAHLHARPDAARASAGRRTAAARRITSAGTQAPGREHARRSSRTSTGVVGSEVPSTWPAAALEAQAVAARSYALASLGPVVTAQHVRPLLATRAARSTAGSTAETPADERGRHGDGAPGRRSTTARSRRRYFSSSSGGQTVSAAEAIGTPVPYLVSVPDPYDTLSPHHDWGPVAFDAAAAAKALDLAGPLLDLTPTAGPSGAHRDGDRGRPDDPVDADRHRRPRRPRPAVDVVPGRLAHAHAAAVAGRLRAAGHAGRDRAAASPG